MDQMKHANECTFVIFSENSPGVLHRITVLFTRRKINIESLTVAGTEMPGVSRFTIVVRTSMHIAEKIVRQARRIIEVLRAEVHDNRSLIYKEIAFFRVGAPDAAGRQNIAAIARGVGAMVVAIDPETVVLEGTGSEDEIQRMFDVFKPFKILEFVRSGRVAMSKNITDGKEEMTPPAKPAPMDAGELFGI